MSKVKVIGVVRAVSITSPRREVVITGEQLVRHVTRVGDDENLHLFEYEGEFEGNEKFRCEWIVAERPIGHLASISRSATGCTVLGDVSFWLSHQSCS